MKRFQSTAGLDDATLDQIVDAVVGRVRDRLGANRSQIQLPAAPAASVNPMATPVRVAAPTVISRQKRHGVYDDLDTAVAAARTAFEAYEKLPLSTRYEVVAAMRRAALS